MSDAPADAAQLLGALPEWRPRVELLRGLIEKGRYTLAVEVGERMALTASQPELDEVLALTASACARALKPTCARDLLALVPAARAGDVKLDTEDQKTLYALGLALSRNLATFNLMQDELATVEAGMSDGLFAKDKKVELDKYGQNIQEFAQARAKVSADKEKEASKPFLEKMAQEKGAKKLDSGVIYIEEKAGTGDAPKPTDKVKVYYTGTLPDGTVFASSVERGQPATFPLNQVVKCWTEGFGMMKPGGKAKLVCPSDVAYGDRGAPPKIKPGSTLVFDVELVEIVKDAPPAPGAPGAATGATGTKPKEEPKE